MKLSQPRPIRILHVVGGMNRGGTETWLMNILRNIDRDRFRMDFLVHTTQPCAYDDEIRDLGSQIIPCLYPSKPGLYARNFKRILHEHGPYDTVHSHVHHFSGYVLRLAQQADVPVRIAHSHLDTSQLDAKAGLLRRGYLKLMKRWIARHATIGLAASRKAGVALFGSNWDTDPSRQILYCSIDLTPFQKFVDPVSVRTELGIPPDAFVIGHVGRFDEQKNHLFLVEIAAEVAKQEPKMRLLLVGDGPLRSEIEQKVVRLDLATRTVFAGVRPDVPRLMLSAMDVFLFPSLYEGLGLVLIEAQAAGLPCIFSDLVPEEADLVKSLIRRFSLSEPPSVWADAILAERSAGAAITQEHSLAIVEKLPFNIAIGLKDLVRTYLSCLSMC
jgi:glycosyltransferase involved in cell wall biosynthesis